MIDGRTVGRGRELVGAPDLRRRHRGGVGFDQQAVEGDDLEGVLLRGLAGVEEVAVEREVSAASGEPRDHLGGAAVGME